MELKVNLKGDNEIFSASIDTKKLKNDIPWQVRDEFIRFLERIDVITNGGGTNSTPDEFLRLTNIGEQFNISGGYYGVCKF